MYESSSSFEISWLRSEAIAETTALLCESRSMILNRSSNSRSLRAESSASLRISTTRCSRKRTSSLAEEVPTRRNTSLPCSPKYSTRRWTNSGSWSSQVSDTSLALRSIWVKQCDQSACRACSTYAARYRFIRSSLRMTASVTDLLCSTAAMRSTSALTPTSVKSSAPPSAPASCELTPPPLAAVAGITVRVDWYQFGALTAYTTATRTPATV